MKTLLFTLIFSLSVPFYSVQAIQPQRAPNWCWAAAVQDVLADLGRHVPQTQIAATLDGWPRNRPATTQEVRMLLNAYGVRAWQSGRPASPQELYATLSRGSRIIAFINPGRGQVGHFVVLSGIDPRGAVVMEDPAFGRTSLIPIHTLYGILGWRDAVVIP